MDFKNKQGTVDARNVNLGFKPPEFQDGHNIILNFENSDDGSTHLNFGDDNAAWLKARIDTSIRANIQTTYTDSDVNLASLKAKLETGFNALIYAQFQNAARLKAQLNTSFTSRIYVTDIEPAFAALKSRVNSGFDSNIHALFDINHYVGLSYRLTAQYQQALPCLTAPDIPFSKPIFKVLNSAFFYEGGLTISSHTGVGFERAKPIYRAVQTVFEQATGLSQDWQLIWQENLRLFISRSILFEESEKLWINRETTWQEMIRKRKQITYAHEVAHVFEKSFWLSWDKGLEVTLKSDIPWEKAQSIHYRKHAIEPWPEPEIPEYVGTTDLNFICLCHEVVSHNVILNFGADDCIPSISNRDWWYIVNKIEVARLDNGQIINVLSGNYRTDRSSWCWSYSLVVPASEITKLDPIAGQPVILKIVVNGYEHLMLLEDRTRSRQFAQITYSLTGRSVSALLDSPSSPARAFLQENERSSVQLVQAEIDRSAYPDLGLNWQLIDALGWIVPTESFSYSGLTPIKAIQEIAAAGGGFIYSEPSSQAITIKPLYKKTWWDAIAIEEFDVLLPEAIVITQSTNDVKYPDYNAITLTNDHTGLTGSVKRTGTAGDILYQTENNRLFTSASVMGSFGKAKLAKSGLVETHKFDMPLTSEVGQTKPGDVLAFNAEWWGIVDSVECSFEYSRVMQSVTVERVNHE